MTAEQQAGARRHGRRARALSEDERQGAPATTEVGLYARRAAVAPPRAGAELPEVRTYRGKRARRDVPLIGLDTLEAPALEREQPTGGEALDREQESVETVQASPEVIDPATAPEVISSEEGADADGSAAAPLPRAFNSPTSPVPAANVGSKKTSWFSLKRKKAMVVDTEAVQPIGSHDGVDFDPREVADHDTQVFNPEEITSFDAVKPAASASPVSPEGGAEDELSEVEGIEISSADEPLSRTPVGEDEDREITDKNLEGGAEVDRQEHGDDTPAEVDQVAVEGDPGEGEVHESEPHEAEAELDDPEAEQGEPEDASEESEQGDAVDELEDPDHEDLEDTPGESELGNPERAPELASEIEPEAESETEGEKDAGEPAAVWVAEKADDSTAARDALAPVSPTSPSGDSDAAEWLEVGDLPADQAPEPKPAPRFEGTVLNKPSRTSGGAGTWIMWILVVLLLAVIAALVVTGVIGPGLTQAAALDTPATMERALL